MQTPFIEKDCTFSHEGKSFTAGGTVITDSRLIAYPAENGILKDWHGNQIGTYRVLSSRKAIFFGHWSWQGNTYYFMRAEVCGKTYAIRGFGVGMIARGKALKPKQSRISRAQHDLAMRYMAHLDSQIADGRK